MGKKITALFALLLCLGCLTACGGNSAGGSMREAEQNRPTETAVLPHSETVDEPAPESSEDGKRTAFDGVTIQTDNPNRATRVIENGTKVNLLFGDDIVIPATLNDSEAAQALISQLPYTIQANRGAHDYCGRIEELFPYSEEEEHYGWLNGDIDFTTSNWLAIFFNYEAESDYDGGHVNLGVVDCDLSELEGLSGSYEVTIELAE